MEKEILDRFEEQNKKFEEQNKKLDMIYDSVEKSRKYFLWSLIFNIAIFVIPLIGLIFVIPWFLKTMDPSTYGL